MISTGQKWLLGCGIGCAAIIMILVAIITGGVLFIRGRLQPVQQAAESHDKLLSTLGKPESFVPRPDGAIPPDRMETFISVRERLRGPQEKLDSVLTDFDFDRLNQEQKSFGEVLGILNGLSAIITPFGEYYGNRNQALLESKMSLGEYIYIYSLAYHSWLGHKPEDGPPLLSKVARTGRDSTFSPEIIRDQYRHLFLTVLGNQLRGFPENDKSELRARIKREIELLESDAGRQVWQDGLPAPLEISLQPFRSRLEPLYNRTTNCFELLQLNERGQRFRWSSKAEQEPGTSDDIRPIQAEAEVDPATGKESLVTYMVSDGVLSPVAEKWPVPPYTEEAKKARVEGTVELRGIVRKDGSMGNVRIVRGLGHGLDESATRTLSTEWKFRPASLKGSPVDVRATIQIRFTAR